MTSAVGQFCAIAWEIKNRGLTPDDASALFFGKEFSRDTT